MELTRGVYTGELELSKGPVLGDWIISSVVNGQTYNKTFEVASYILPKFLIHIQAPNHVTFQDNIITANIQTT